MLILKELQFKNFLSHSDTKIEFRPNQKMLIDGKSGAGKSAIVESIVWVLYGKGRTDNRSLIRHTEKSCHVELTLLNKETEEVLKIVREASMSGKNTLKVLKQTKKGNFLPIKVTGVRAIQEHLETEILNSSYLLFINSIIYPQDNVESFVKQTASKRKDILLEIAKVQSYDVYYDKAKEELSKATNGVERYEALIENYQTNIKDDQEHADNLETVTKEVNGKQEELSICNTSYDLISKELKTKMEERDEANKVKDKIEKLRVGKQVAEDKINEANKFLIEIMAANHDKELEELRPLEQYVTDYTAILKMEEEASDWDARYIELLKYKPVDLDYEKEIDYVNEQLINALGTEMFVCPETHSECPYMNKEKNERIERLKETLKSKTVQKEKYIEEEIIYQEKILAFGKKPVADVVAKNFLDREIRKLDILKSKIEQAEKDLVKQTQVNTDTISENKSLLAEIEKEIVKTSGNIPSTEELDKEIPALLSKQGAQQTIARELSSELAELKTKLSTSQQASERIKTNKDEVKKLKTSIKKLGEEAEGMRMLKSAFGQKGIKAMVVDYIIPRLEEKINDILGKLSDFRIRLETQKSNAKGDSTVEGLFITIFNEQGLEFNFSNYSGGERLKIIVAISEALSEIQNIGFRVLDELFVGLDAESTEKFAEVVATLQERFDQMLCISHLRDIKDTFDEKIEIVKINGISQIN